MFAFLVTVVHNPAFKHAGIGILSGALVAAKTDYDAFTKFNKWHDVRDYDWGIATFRWFKGAVIGAVGVTALGQWLG